MTEERFAALARSLTEEHRRLDDLFGRFLAAAQAASLEGAREAMEAFDETLRHHMQVEEQDLYPRPPRQKLVPPSQGEEGERERVLRELLIEHVQIRELSGMILRLLKENADLVMARGLAGNLARRWDAHTVREEREVLAGLLSS